MKKCEDKKCNCECSCNCGCNKLLVLIIVLLVGAFLSYILYKEEIIFKDSYKEANNNAYNYKKIEKKIKNSKSNEIIACTCNDDFDSDCKSYNVSKNDMLKIVDKIKSSDEATLLPTSTFCSTYSFESIDKDGDTIISGFVGDNQKSILTGCEEKGYAFDFNEKIDKFFAELIDGKKSKPYEIEITEKKPILYLYPKKETKVKVTFAKPKKLTTTYPKYNDGWKVTAKPNGDLTDENKNYYYGLYWEEKSNNNIDFKKGYYVTKDEALTFLEDKLKYIGLTDRERNEFIIYWLPVLEKNKKSVVYFELTEERQKKNELIIEPKPDSLLRLSIHIKKVDKKPKNLEKQKLSNFKRKGFVAVEWGGKIHK